MFGVLMVRYISAAVLGALCLAVPASAVSKNTAQTVAQCRVNLDSCRNDIGMSVVAFEPLLCTPNDMPPPTDAEVKGILSWLEAHPQVHPDDWDAALEAALEAIYPCSN
jgi:hypothetical protein